MKAKMKIVALGALMMGMFLSTSKAQDSLSFNAGIDLYSRYFWRGLSFGHGPHLQPSVNMKYGGLTIGYWGSYDLNGGSYTEADFYASYATSFGLTATLTDYSTGSNYFNSNPDTLKDHAAEIALAYSVAGLTLTGAYVFNEAVLPGTIGGDTYVELAYSFLGSSSLAVGAGNGWYTADTEFALCNVMFKTVKTIKVTDSFSLPVTGIIMLNPSAETLSVGAGLTF
jgi:hypothetical protein